MNTDDLIEQLGRELAPVAPLQRPGKRAAAWSLGAALYLAVLVASTFEPAANTADARFVVPQLVAIATGILAAAAAFASVIPGYRKRVLVWPVIATLVWLGSLIAAGGEPASIVGAQHEWLCVAVILVGGAPLLAVLAAMLRRGAPLNPAVTAAFAALAVGTLANVGACVSQPHADHYVTLVWHGGAILALALACVLGARLVLRWAHAGRIRAGE